MTANVIQTSGLTALAREKFRVKPREDVLEMKRIMARKGEVDLPIEGETDDLIIQVGEDDLTNEVGEN